MDGCMYVFCNIIWEWYDICYGRIWRVWWIDIAMLYIYIYLYDRPHEMIWLG